MFTIGEPWNGGPVVELALPISELLLRSMWTVLLGCRPDASDGVFLSEGHLGSH